MKFAADACWLSIAELGRKLRAGETTAVELAEYFLDRLEQFGPKYNAVVTLTRERALSEARQADADLKAGNDRGPLHGIPYGAKDLLAVTGYPTTWGAAPLKDQTFDEDAAVVTKLKDAGAVLCAKLAMVEIAGGFGYQQANASFTGPGLNAWNRERWSGGSSSGSGSAVAAGLVPFAIGSETSGSIITPACYSGLSGLRPTFGLVSKRGAMALSWSLDRLGPMCRSANDCRLVLNAIAGFDPEDLCSAPAPQLSPRDKNRRWKFATVKSPNMKLQPGIDAAYAGSLEVLKQIGDFTEIELPAFPYGLVVSTILNGEMAAAFESFIAQGKSWELTAPEDRAGCHSNLMVSAVDYIQAQRIRALAQRALDKALAGYDAVVSPSLPHSAPPAEGRFADWGRGFSGSPIQSAGVAAGLPALTVPNGFADDGLPSGLHFLARAWDDERLLDLGEAYQAKTDWHTKRPEVN
jgi:aspartyl-tRNA(Asn)/glutamyl-tRNA(Gln) amidotransferase subunit A